MGKEGGRQFKMGYFGILSITAHLIGLLEHQIYNGIIGSHRKIAANLSDDVVTKVPANNCITAVIVS